MFYTYILQSESKPDEYYVGFTSDLLANKMPKRLPAPD